jgi:hypothetical protein
MDYCVMQKLKPDIFTKQSFQKKMLFYPQSKDILAVVFYVLQLLTLKGERI